MGMRTRPARLLWCAVAGTLLAAMLVVATDARAADPAAADALFRRGRELLASGDYALACPLFQESMRLDPAPGTLLNLADCTERTGKLATAWELFDRLATEVPATDERYALSLQRATSLAPRVPRLTVLLPDGLTAVRVYRDDIEVGAPSFGVPLPVDPGSHVIVVSAPNCAARRITLTVSAGESVEFIAQPGPRKNRSVARGAGWIAGGVGLASLGTGAFFGVRALEEREASDAHCARGVCTDPHSLAAYEAARADARVTDVAIGVGVVALAVGGYLLATSRGWDAARAVGAHVSPSGIGAAW
jgi:tetratricopeptide (TPR) repeat protein